jgi:putative ABC transport system permease protein
MMNRLAERPNGAIVSKRLLDILSLGVGDVMPMTVIADNSTSFRLNFTIVDTYDYFPTLQDVRERPSAIVNAEFLDLEIGPFPSRIWMRLSAGSDGKTVLDELENARVIPVESRDLGDTLRRDQQRLERVGLFGLLSICFLAGALLATVGILLYSFTTLLARAQRFAVMRAMGVRRAEVVRSLLVEYVVMLAYGILAGISLGVLASRLYVPLFPLTDQVDVPVPPFNAVIDWPRAAWIAALMAATLALIGSGTIVRMARERVFEALRMGGWE